jgi:hypothetical protein
MHPDWVRSLRDQVHTAGAKLFVKQIGSNHALWPNVTGKGEDPAQWPADLRVQDFPLKPLQRSVQRLLGSEPGSKSLDVSSKDRFRNRQRPLSLDRGNAS